MTKRPRILLHNSETVKHAELLRNDFPDAEVCECNSYAELPGMIDSFRPDVVYSVRFSASEEFPRAALFGSNALQWVSNGGAGTDHYGMWDPTRITVTNGAGVAADMMAEYLFGGFLHFTLDVPGLQTDKAARRWAVRKVAPLAGKTLLIIGLGHTGRAVALRAKAFGMSVLGTRARPCEMENVDEVHPAGALADLLPRADYVVVSTPLVPSTKGLLSAGMIDLMKTGAILGDVSRGGVVDQTALALALESGRLAAAVLDVFETEPLPVQSPLWALENVIISPHCSSVSADWEDASFNLFLQNLARWMQGQELKNIVDPVRGY